jgi:hypothetical protein
MTSNNEQHGTREDEIPLLEDVVMPDELKQDPETVDPVEAAPKTAESLVPEYDEVLLAMRDDIAARLLEDLQPMIATAVQRAIAEAIDRIEQVLHDELDSPLGHHIRGLIDQRMEAEFGPRNHHVRSKDDER